MIGTVVKIKIGVDSMKIVFYGAGNMASAIFIGMIENNVVKPDQIYLTSRSQQEKIMFFKENLGVNVSYDDAELLDGADYAILASKPQSFPDVAKRIRPHLEEKTKIVSVMAGTQITLTCGSEDGESDCETYAEHKRYGPALGERNHLFGKLPGQGRTG